ncbi:MAG: hypothetical protein QOI94_3367 [Acidobacteriaceae bacterium]|nr:hypothetical protein [Acidobacteriaceae bacterium]
MKLRRIAILVCLGLGGLFQLVRAEESSVMFTFNGLRFECFPVVNVPYTAEETASRFHMGNWRVSPPVFVARDSQGRTLRRQRIKNMFVKGAIHPNYTTVTINDPSAHTFTKWIEGVEDETSITVGLSYPACAPRWPEEAHETLVGTGPGAIVAYDKEWLLALHTESPMYTDIHSELLGEQMVEGQSVEGLRTTKFTPGDSGMPDVIWTGDRWYSPKLQLVLIDLRTSRPPEATKVELKKIRLLEPDPDLFKPPDGYHLAEEHKP